MLTGCGVRSTKEAGTALSSCLPFASLSIAPIPHRHVPMRRVAQSGISRIKARLTPQPQSNQSLSTGHFELATSLQEELL
jgi:hypothetical protein